MLDTQGPEIRTGNNLTNEALHLEAGGTITLTVNDDFKDKQTNEILYVTYKDIVKTIKVGACILLDDGAVELKVLEINPYNNKDALLCSILNSGSIKSRRGVNLPGVTVNLPPMSEKDKADIK